MLGVFLKLPPQAQTLDLKLVLYSKEAAAPGKLSDVTLTKELAVEK